MKKEGRGKCNGKRKWFAKVMLEPEMSESDREQINRGLGAVGNLTAVQKVLVHKFKPNRMFHISHILSAPSDHVPRVIVGKCSVL